MYFSAFIGNDGDASIWQEALSRHACWLGLTPQVESLRLDDSRRLSFGWLDFKPSDANRRVKETEEFILATSFGEVIDEGSGALTNALYVMDCNASSNAIRIEASLKSGEIAIMVPPTTPQQFYFARNSHGFYFSDDMRLFRYLVETSLDERAIYALFQYGAIPPPLTIYKNVRRIPNGHVFKLQPNSDELIHLTCFSLRDCPVRNGAQSNPETKIERALDELLTGIPQAAVLYFSGGVDSGLLASRLAKLGRTDVRLLNYAFDPDDEESRLALRMASYFGLECHQVHHDLRKVSDVLQRIGKDYSFPFGDFSTVPTNVLVHESLEWAQRSFVVIEGTGADGAFGAGLKYPKWQRVYRVPAFLRKRADAAYSLFKLWQRNSRLERLGRVARKSMRMPLGQAMVAENALEGIAYSIPQQSSADLEEAIRVNFEAMSIGVELEERLSFLDLVWVCAGRMAPKSFDPLRKHGVRTIYPYLDLPILAVSSSLAWDEKCAYGEEKAILKRLLARDVPRQWVYRLKRGFEPPHQPMVASPAMQEFLRDVVLSRQNPLINFCETDKVLGMIERARKGQELCPGAYDFIWTLTFTSAWLSQLPEQRMPQCDGIVFAAPAAQAKPYAKPSQACGAQTNT